ncbi:hypothetical protein [Kocuria nitroreducens]|uniref:hypothetical protein n=1 Tax=Kocuria nitroreducens TaxID=3058914 RepID=UPI0036DD1C7D
MGTEGGRARPGAPRRDRTWWWGIGAWAGTLAWLVFLGPAPALVLGPVLGTTLVLYGRLERAHAQVMDARRGLPPAPAP